MLFFIVLSKLLNYAVYRFFCMRPGLWVDSLRVVLFSAIVMLEHNVPGAFVINYNLSSIFIRQFSIFSIL
jgi:hypothetical protein